MQKQQNGTNGRRVLPPPNFEHVDPADLEERKELSGFAQWSRDDDMIREALLHQAAEQPVQTSIQFDCRPSSYDWTIALKLEEMDCPVRIQINPDADKEIVLKTLKAIRRVIKRATWSNFDMDEYEERQRLVDVARYYRARKLLGAFLDGLSSEDHEAIIDHWHALKQEKDDIPF